MGDSIEPATPSYRPPTPENPPNIALIGCGDITDSHLTAYRKAGWDVVAFSDIDVSAARERRDEYYPDADIHTDADEVFDREDVGVVDIATHPEPRQTLIEDAIRAGNHVLSQKPFVLDIDTGERLVGLAEEHGVRLAVNQNGRWAPHWSWIRHATDADHAGEVLSVHLDAHWDHNSTTENEFDHIRHAILYDYAIHYFDILACIMKDKEPKRVFGSVARSSVQTASPPLLGQATVEYEGGQASLIFDGNNRYGQVDRTYVGGTEGTLQSKGPDLTDQTVSLHTEGGAVYPDLDGSWFPIGFQGTMGELLCAIEENREPDNSGRDNLRSVELCYAAVAAAEDGEAKVPGEVTELRQGDPTGLAPR